MGSAGLVNMSLKWCWNRDPKDTGPVHRIKMQCPSYTVNSKHEWDFLFTFTAAVTVKGKRAVSLFVSLPDQTTFCHTLFWFFSRPLCPCEPWLACPRVLTLLWVIAAGRLCYVKHIGRGRNIKLVGSSIRCVTWVQRPSFSPTNHHFPVVLSARSFRAIPGRTWMSHFRHPHTLK